MAALIERETNVTPELVEGKRGEFSVLVDGEIVARKDSSGFPGDEDILTALRGLLG